MAKRAITSEKFPVVGPYSPGVEEGGLVFVSGQIPLRDGVLVSAEVKAQTAQVMENLKAVLEHAGLGFGDVLRFGIFLTDLGDFDDVNEVYASYLEEPYPARSTVQVAALPKGAKVEIEAIAARPQSR